MQPRHHTGVGGGKVGYRLIGLDFREVLIFSDAIPLLYVPLQQFDLGNTFTDIRELKLTCHDLTSPPHR